MTDTIGVKLTAQDGQFEATAKKSSAAVAALALQEERLAKAAGKAGVDQKKFAQQFRSLEKQQLAQASKENREASRAVLRRTAEEKKGAEKATADKARSEKQAQTAADKALKRQASDDARQKKNDARESEKAAKKREAATKKDNAYRTKAAKESKQNLAADVSGLKSGALAAVSMGAAILGIAVAGGVAVAAIANLALKMGNAKAETLGALDILTNGRGVKALALIDKEAQRLGLTIQETRDDFIKFRQAGLDNKQSAALLKLKADLIATKHPASQVEEAVSRVLSYASNGIQTKDQAAAAGRAMALLARQAHIAGDGTVAAALAATTLEGALNRIDNAKTKALESLGEKIKPSIDKAATSVANLVTGFLDSKRGQAVLQATADTIISVADTVTAAAPKIAGLWATVNKALDDPKASLALDALKGTAYLAAGGITVLAVGAGLLVAPLIAIGAAGTAAIAGVGLLVKKAADLGPEMYQAGKNVVLGLAKGITDAAGAAVDAVVSLAKRISRGFTGELEIKSPSRKFERHGINIGKGTDIGVEKSMPTGEDIAKRLTPVARIAPAKREQSISVAAQSSGNTYSVTIQVQASGSSEEDARNIRRELDLWYQGIQQQQGRAA